MSENNGAKPAEAPAALDLDTLERESNNTREFTFIHEGRRWTLSSPMEIDWQDVVVAMNDPFSFFRRTLPAEDADAFLKTKLPVWKMRALVERYMAHYGVPNEGELGALPR